MRFFQVYRKETESGKKKLESGRKRHTAELLVSDSVHGNIGIWQGAAGTPVFTGISMTGGGESVNRGHMTPNKEGVTHGWAERILVITWHISAPMMTESLGPNEAWT